LIDELGITEVFLDFGWLVEHEYKVFIAVVALVSLHLHLLWLE
jgi:hypothetical protein